MRQQLMARLSGERGFTLVELLVVIGILAVVGSVAVAGLVNGMRQSAHAQDRVEALTTTQTALARMSRELRAADPLREVATDRVTLDVRRGGELIHFRYRVVADGAGAFQLEQQRWVFDEGFDGDDFTPQESEAAQTSQRVLLGRLTDAEVFEARDSDGDVLDDSATATAANASRLLMVVRREVQPDRPAIEVETSVTVRNR